jgi:hypothetical protein
MTLESLTKPSAKNMETHYLASNRARRSCGGYRELMPHTAYQDEWTCFYAFTIYGLTFSMEAFG